MVLFAGEIGNTFHKTLEEHQSTNTMLTKQVESIFNLYNKQGSLQNIDKNTFCILKEGNTRGYIKRSLLVAQEELKSRV